jgi:DNA-binding NarL/FixJ family response regulator
VVPTVVRLPTAHAPNAAASGSVTSVVVISDNLVTRLGLHGLIGQFEHVSWRDGAANAAQGRFAVQRLRPNVALVDLRLPVSEWLTVVSELARTSGVLAISRSTEAWFVASALRAGATSYLLPSELTAEHLERTIIDTGAGKSWLSPLISSTRRDAPDISALSRREVEVLNQVARGRSNAEIARALFLSEGTVKNHLHRIFPKLGVRNRAEAIVIWADWSRGVPA